MSRDYTAPPLPSTATLRDAAVCQCLDVYVDEPEPGRFVARVLVDRWKPGPKGFGASRAEACKAALHALVDSVFGPSLDDADRRTP